MAFKSFVIIGKEKADKLCLVMHTQPVDENGTDLPAVMKLMAPECNIIFSDKRRSTRRIKLSII
jgi:hypothetical protein